MGSDGVKKYAIIVNGDTERRHLMNVERSLRALEARGFETFVASTERPGAAHDHYEPATREGLERLIAGAKAMAGDGSDLVVYVTGHGMRGREAELALADGEIGSEFAEYVDGLPYARRVVVMDQCYGGNWGQRFVDDPRTLFISSGSSDERTCCNEFAPFFWDRDVVDLNSDGSISWQERFAHAINRGDPETKPRYSPSPGFVDDGKAPFPADVVSVTDARTFERLVSSLEPGQYAVVMLSMDGCIGCDKYRPIFRDLAKRSGGQHSFVEISDADFASEKYGVNTFPSVMIIDHTGDARQIPIGGSLLQEIAGYDLPARERRVKDLMDVLEQSDSLFKRAVLLDAMIGIRGLEGRLLEADDARLKWTLGLINLEAQDVSTLEGVEAFAQLVGAGAWELAQQDMEDTRKLGDQLASDMRGWIVIAAALDRGRGSRIPSKLLLEAFKNVIGVGPTRVAFEIVLERGHWKTAASCVEFAERRYNRAARTALGEAIASQARRSDSVPSEFLLFAIKNVEDFEDVIFSFSLLLEREDWGRVLEAIEHSRANYTAECDDAFAKSVLRSGREDAVPFDILVQAFMSSCRRETALALMEAILSREGNEDAVEHAMFYSQGHHKPEFKAELKKFVETYRKANTPAEPAEKPEPDTEPRSDIPLKFRNDLIYD